MEWWGTPRQSNGSLIGPSCSVLFCLRYSAAPPRLTPFEERRREEGAVRRSQEASRRLSSSASPVSLPLPLSLSLLLNR